MRIAFVFLALAASAADRLAVVEKIAGQVSFYDPAGKRIASVPVGKHPHEIALSPDGKLLYVTDNGILWMTEAGEGGNTISILDAAAMKKAGMISLGRNRRPHGMDIDPKTNRMVVTVENPDGLLLIDLAQRTVLRRYDVKGSDPHMVMFGPGARFAYVSNTASGNVAAVNLESGEVKLIATGARPQGGVLSPDGKLAYIGNSESFSISILDTTRNEVVGSIRTSGKGPGRVAFTPDGKTLVYNLQADEAVGFADAAARKETGFVKIGGRPLSLTLSRDGRTAYAGIQDQDRIVMVSVNFRRVIGEVKTPKGAGPDPALPLP